MSLILKDIPQALQRRLEKEGIQGDRLKSLDTFFSMQSESLKHGLNINTNLENINYSGVINESKKEISYSAKANLSKEPAIFNLEELNSSKDITKNQKEIIFAKISEQWNKKLNKIDFLHSALCDVRIIIFKEDSDMKETFEIKNSIHGNSYNHLVIVVGKNSSVNLSIKTLSNIYNTTTDAVNDLEKKDSKNSSENIITDFTDIIAGDNSKLGIVEFRNLASKDIVYGTKSLHLGNNATANWIGIDKNSKLTIITQHAILSGENSKITMNNILCGKASEYFLNNISEHAEKNTESLIRTKAVLNASKAIVKGLVKINKNAEFSRGYQKSDMLLTDEDSRGVSIPDLEIHNDKVKCTHGSTISRIDAEKIFYLQSRGLSKDEAESLMIEGFYDIILNEIQDEKLRGEIRKEVIET